MIKELRNKTEVALFIENRFRDFPVPHAFEATVIIAVFIVIGVVANVAMLVVLTFTKKRLQHPRMNICLRSLAFADLLVCGIVAPLDLLPVSKELYIL